MISKTFYQGLKQVFSVKHISLELATMQLMDYLMLFVLFLAQTLVFVLTGIFDYFAILSFLTAVFTVMNLILVNRGRITNYFWGVLNTIFWIVVSIQSHLIGDVLSQSFYLVMQFVGIYFWQKNLNEYKNNDGEIMSQKLKPLMMVVALLAFLIIYGIVLCTSSHLHGQQIWLDATLLPLGMISMILMAYAYRLQWLGWFIIDAINIVIWYNNWQISGNSAISMFVLQIIMFLNCIYGTYLWFRQTTEK